jgi:hypothetical protein
MLAAQWCTLVVVVTSLIGCPGLFDNEAGKWVVNVQPSGTCWVQPNDVRPQLGQQYGPSYATKDAANAARAQLHHTPNPNIAGQNVCESDGG